LKSYQLTYKRYGERSVLVEWPNKIDENILKSILCFKNSIEQKLHKVILDISFSYNSLLITYMFNIDNIYTVFEELKSIYSNQKDEFILKSNLWTIPVCYDVEFGVDLELFSKEKKLSKSEIIKLHSESVYSVYSIGFLPGFLYLGGLNKRLHMQRKSQPVLKVKKGAVGIGGNQTGIYPQDSPGGWHVIGNSPINFFNSNNERPCFAKVLDKIHFKPISKNEYDDIKVLVDAGVYQIESEVLLD